MSKEKTCKRTKRGRKKKQPYKSLFQRHGTESNLEKAEDAYAAYCTGDHIVSSVCGKYKMPLHLGLEIAGQIMPKEEVGNITIPAKILAKHGGGATGCHEH
jgi:hypothetical protein